MIFKNGVYYPLLEGASLGEYEANLADGLDYDGLSQHAQDAIDFEDRLDIDDLVEARKEALADHLDGPFPGEWAIRGGTILKIAEMTTEHLDNAIRYFERMELGDHPKIQELREERKRR